MNINEIKTRSNAGNGFWLMILLPISLIISSQTQPELASATYKLSSIFSLGFIFSAVLIIDDIGLSKQKYTVSSTHSVVLTCLIGALFKICLQRELWFSLWSGILCTMVYQKLYWFFLKKLPNSFSFGEAAICVQAYTLVFYFTGVSAYEAFYKTPTSVMRVSTLTIQLGIFALTIISGVTYLIKVTNSKKFFGFVGFVITLFVLLPLAVLIQQNPFIWILNLIVDDLSGSKVIISWGVCSIFAILSVFRQIKGAKRASTSIRKIFHLLSVIVFLLGLLYNCNLLYLASGVVLIIFFTLEILRIGKVSPFDKYLLDAVVLFIDEKDAGVIALTPIYLLAGCSLPIWLHPGPCDVTNASVFNLLPMLSGVLSVGVGDTAASIVGSNFGRFHWKGSKKTIEGTLAFIIAQALFLAIFVHFKFLVLVTERDYIQTGIAIIATALIEAKSDQIDNLVLPFVMYIILMI